jgi:hypothetical protein
MSDKMYDRCLADTGAIQVSRVILKPRNTHTGFPEVHIRCRNVSGELRRPGKGPGSWIDYPNIRKGVPKLCGQLF